MFAMEYVEKAFSIAKEMKYNHFWLGYCHIGFGVVYSVICEYEMGFKHFMKSLAIFKEINNNYLVALLLNTKNQILSKETISIGSLNSSIVHPREVFKPAIKKSASAMIVAHNHPSGDPSPSREDIEVTKRLIQAGEILGIDILDHVIIGENRYVSMKEKGLIG